MTALVLGTFLEQFVDDFLALIALPMYRTS